MNSIVLETTRFPRALESRMAEDLKQQKNSFASGKEMRQSAFFSEAAWRRFADCWTRLTLDRHMADAGVYRYRRYSQFELDALTGALVRLPHGPYEQPLYINKLNGGIPREFDPLEDEMTENALFEAMLRSLASLFDKASDYASNWNIRLHPYRILADDGVPGNPTPEGLHRDGVDFIVTLMVKRHNVIGGETTVTDNSGNILGAVTLRDEMDILVADDAMTMHGVTPVQKAVAGMDAFRDVLVIAYTRMPSTGAASC